MKLEMELKPILNSLFTGCFLMSKHLFKIKKIDLSVNY
jgi:hypothetical protein